MTIHTFFPNDTEVDDDVVYRQCRIIRNFPDCVQMAWLPEEFAVAQKEIVIRDKTWSVLHVYDHRLTGKQLRMRIPAERPTKRKG
jgi:hypothetical protein